MLRPRPAQDRPRIPQDPPGPSASTVFLPLALARTMFLRSSDDGEHDFLALRHWRGRFSCPLQALASIIFSPFGACEDVSPAFWRCRARCFCPLALASTMFLPFGTGEDDAPAIWRRRARCSCPLALASTMFLRFGAGEHASPARWRWRARFSCPLALASTLLLPFGVGERAFLALWRGRARGGEGRLLAY